MSQYFSEAKIAYFTLQRYIGPNPRLFLSPKKVLHQAVVLFLPLKVQVFATLVREDLESHFAVACPRLIVDDQELVWRQMCARAEDDTEKYWVLATTHRLEGWLASCRIQLRVCRHPRSRLSIFIARRVRYETIVAPIVISVPASPKAMAIFASEDTA